MFVSYSSTLIGFSWFAVLEFRRSRDEKKLQKRAVFRFEIAIRADLCNTDDNYGMTTLETVKNEKATRRRLFYDPNDYYQFVRYEVHGDHALYERRPHDDPAQNVERAESIFEYS